MYNVIKGLGASQEDGKRQVIDSNERMAQIMEAQKKELERLAEERRKQIIEDYLDGLEPDEEGKPILPTDEEGNVLLPVDDDGVPLLYVHSDGFLYDEEEEIIEEEPEEELTEEETEPVVEEPPIDREKILAEIQQEADAILAQANADAQEIRSQANTEAEQLQQQAREALAEAEQMKGQAAEEGRAAGHEEGYKAGYEEGHQEVSAKLQGECDAKMAEADEKVAAMQADLDAKAAEFAEETERIRAEFAAKQEGLEKQMVEVFCDIIDKVFHIEFSDKQEIILHLVDNVMTNTPGSKEYMVRVNDHNYGILQENKDNLIEKVGSGIGIDIIKDPLLGDEECQIETDGGVYDCGMDVQLANLLKDLKALSLV
ncbi:MAG: hypothetical protein IJV04_09645 [Lachnospiraceae bacterium]|nr:hypothetical protein [Lachnospiraceae bacterium]